MAQDVIAVYPGTFDPITLGHEDLLRRATGLFDRVIVAVASFSGLMRDFVLAHGARVMVRGLRSATDFDYEYQLAGMNRSLMADVETVFMTPSSQYQFLSSTYVREISTLGGDVAQFVSPEVEQRLAEKLKSRSAN